MQPNTDADRAYWQGVLTAGGATALPRWTTAPVPGVAELTTTVDDDVLRRLHALTDELSLPLRAAVHAAHARVLAALTGDGEVVAGYVGRHGDRPLPLRLNTGSGSWRALLRGAGEAESALLAHSAFPLDALAAELAVA